MVTQSNAMSEEEETRRFPTEQTSSSFGGAAGLSNFKTWISCWHNKAYIVLFGPGCSETCASLPSWTWLAHTI